MNREKLIELVVKEIEEQTKDDTDKEIIREKTVGILKEVVDIANGVAKEKGFGNLVVKDKGSFGEYL